jgi:hypothetical protein
MKAFRLFPVVGLFLSLILVSCKEDIDFAGDHVNTAIVYGLLDQHDTIHYIKITRAFGGGNNSLEVAQIADSSYFESVVATIKETGVSGPRTWELRDTVITGKASGVFYGPEQKLYYFKAVLDPAATYNLDVNINNGAFHVTGETKLVTGFAMTAPASNSAFTFANSQGELKSTRIAFSQGTAETVDGRIEVFFDEYFNGIAQEKSFIWKLGELTGNDIPSSNPGFNAPGATFYDLIRQNATDDETINKRVFKKFRITLTGGSSDLTKYILVNQPTNSLAQSKPTFTNLTATNDAKVIGVFSSRLTFVQERLKFNPNQTNLRAIDFPSLRYLSEGPVTGGLQFCSDNPNDASQSFYCD